VVGSAESRVRAERALASWLETEAGPRTGTDRRNRCGADRLARGEKAERDRRGRTSARLRGDDRGRVRPRPRQSVSAHPRAIHRQTRPVDCRPIQDGTPAEVRRAFCSRAAEPPQAPRAGRGDVEPDRHRRPLFGSVGLRVAGVQAPSRDREAPVSPPRTWLLAEGWRRHALIAVDEIPGSGRGSGARARAQRSRGPHPTRHALPPNSRSPARGADPARHAVAPSPVGLARASAKRTQLSPNSRWTGAAPHVQELLRNSTREQQGVPPHPAPAAAARLHVSLLASRSAPHRFRCTAPVRGPRASSPASSDPPRACTVFDARQTVRGRGPVSSQLGAARVTNPVPIHANGRRSCDES
jgi:hypothetical protein